MASKSEILQVTGVRCERCVMRLGGVLERLDGIESANVTLMGEVSLVYDDQIIHQEAIVGALEAGGFKLLEDFS